MSDVKNTCNNCKYAIFEDYGYSNYTTEGTTFRCALKQHPGGEFDRWYGENESLNYICDKHEVGEPIEMDCDGENGDLLSDEQRRIYNM